MGLIGPNGSGKTTTIKAILNMTEREGGKITVFGKDNIASEQEIKKDIGAVFDSSSFVDEWTMADVEKPTRFFIPPGIRRNIGPCFPGSGLARQRR